MSSPWWSNLLMRLVHLSSKLQELLSQASVFIFLCLDNLWKSSNIHAWRSWISVLSSFKSMKAYGLHKKPGLSTLQSYQGLCPPPQREFERWVDAPGYFAQLNEDYRLPNEYPSLCKNLQKIACCFLYHCTSRVKFLSLVKYEMV